MEVEMVETIELELKYCERCGGLWLRANGSSRVYCPSCMPKVAELPAVRRKSHQAKKGPQQDLEGSGEELLRSGCEGGLA